LGLKTSQPVSAGWTQDFGLRTEDSSGSVRAISTYFDLVRDILRYFGINKFRRSSHIPFTIPHPRPSEISAVCSRPCRFGIVPGTLRFDSTNTLSNTLRTRKNANKTHKTQSFFSDRNHIGSAGCGRYFAHTAGAAGSATIGGERFDFVARRERGKIPAAVSDRASNDATKPKIRQECRLSRRPGSKRIILPTEHSRKMCSDTCQTLNRRSQTLNHANFPMNPAKSLVRRLSTIHFDRQHRVNGGSAVPRI